MSRSGYTDDDYDPLLDPVARRQRQNDAMFLAPEYGQVQRALTLCKTNARKGNS